MPNRWVLAVTTLFAALLFAPASRGDVVRPPPSSCPPGSRGETSHNGPWCAPTTCSSDADCGQPASGGEKMECREQALCVETRTEPSASGWTWGRPFTRHMVHGECDGGSCPGSGSCEVAKRCVTAKAVPPGGRCAVSEPGAPSGGGAAGIGLLLAAAVAVFRRR